MAVTDDVETLSAGSPAPVLSTDKLVLYNARQSPYCQKVRMFLNAKGIPFQVINVDLKNKPEWFLGITPLNLVPVIVEPNGHVLYESLVMSEYLDDTIEGKRRFLPSDPYERAKQKMLIQVLLAKINEPTRNMAMTPKPDNLETLLEAYDFVESQLTRPYLGGDQMGMSDLMIFSHFDRTAAIFSINKLNFDDYKERLPKLHSWIERMRSDDAIRATTYTKEEYISSMMKRRQALAPK